MGGNQFALLADPNAMENSSYQWRRRKASHQGCL